MTSLEKVAGLVIHWIFRRTGRHLFLTDDDEGRPPLLKRMVDDGEYPFMYVLIFSFISYCIDLPLSGHSELNGFIGV